MKALVPHAWTTGDVLSDTDVNENLRAIARDIARSQARRFTYCSVVIPLDGVQDTDTAAERTVPFPRPNDGADTYAVDVVGLEFSVFASTGATWTATVTDENGRTVVLSVDTAGATVEAYTSSNVPLQLSTSDDLDFVLAGDAASTITRGTLTIHCRMDRHQQNSATLTTYAPGLVRPSSSTAGSTLDTQLTNAQLAVTNDEAHTLDMRCICVMANDIAAQQDWRFPSGGGTYIHSARVYAVGVAARTLELVVNAPTGNTATATGTGNLVTANEVVDSSKDDDPTNTTADVEVSLIPAGGAISRAFGFVWLG